MFYTVGGPIMFVVIPHEYLCAKINNGIICHSKAHNGCLRTVIKNNIVSPSLLFYRSRFFARIG